LDREYEGKKRRVCKRENILNYRRE